MKKSLSVLLFLSLAFGSVEEAKRLIEQEDYEEAVLLLREELKKGKGLHVLELYALASVRIGEVEEAIKASEEALRLDPESKTARLVLAEAYIVKNKPDEAINLLVKLPESDEKNFLLGQAYLRKSQPELVRKHLSKVSPSSPRYKEALFYLALLERESGRQSLFLRYQEELKKDPAYGILIEGVLKERVKRFGVRLGMEYDTNVNISSGDVPRRKSTRGVAEFYYIHRGESLDYTARLYGNSNSKVPSYDVYRASVDGRYTKGGIFLPFGLGYTMVGRDYYSAQAYSGLGAYLGELRTSLRVGYEGYRSAPLEEEKRSAPFGKLEVDGSFQGGDFYSGLYASAGYYATKGKNWRRAELSVGGYANKRLGRLGLGISAELTYTPYTQTNTLFGKKRKDTYARLSPFVSYQILPTTYLLTTYSYNRNASNIGIYDYVRHIFSISLSHEF